MFVSRGGREIVWERETDLLRVALLLLGITASVLLLLAVLLLRVTAAAAGVVVVVVGRHDDGGVVRFGYVQQRKQRRRTRKKGRDVKRIRNQISGKRVRSTGKLIYSVFIIMRARDLFSFWWGGRRSKDMDMDT